MKLRNLILVSVTCGILLAGCAAGSNESDVPETSSSTIEVSANSNGTETLTEATGTTAVITSETVLSHVYSFLYSDPSNLSTYEKAEVDEEVQLKEGDIVLILESEDDTARVCIPYLETVLYGEVPADAVSTDFETANQAIISECDLYDAREGAVVTTESATVNVLSLDSDWASVTLTFGGDGTIYWVPADQLSYDFDSEVIDFAE